MAAKKSKGKARAALYIAVAFILGVVAAIVFLRYFYSDLFINTDNDYGGGDVAVIDDLPSPPEIATIPDIPAIIGKAKYRLAIVIDDMGNSIGRLDDIIALDLPVTVAVLPHLSRSADVAKKAGEHGLDLLLHMPMEPLNSSVNDPGPGAVFTTMSAEEVRSTLREDMAIVPGIIGINNHMGSKFTTDAELMRVVMEELKSKGLFFLDSKTTNKSVGVEVAREMDVRTVPRDIFLDNEQDQTYIEGQLRKAIALAKRKGEAVAIGHQYPETILAIKAVMGEDSSAEISIVGISELID